MLIKNMVSPVITYKSFIPNVIFSFIYGFIIGGIYTITGHLFGFYSFYIDNMVFVIATVGGILGSFYSKSLLEYRKMVIDGDIKQTHKQN